MVSIAVCGLTALFQCAAARSKVPNRYPAEISRQQWQAQIKAARECSEQIRRERRFFVAPPPTPEQQAEEASRRVLEDDSLRPGDVVSTNHGLYRFRIAA